jgi:hypothetical protein
VFEWIVGKLIATPIIGTLIQNIGTVFLTWQKQKIDAVGSHEARASELATKEIQLDQREAELNASVVIAEQGNWFTRSVRPSIGWIVVVLLAKVLIWDKALGQWTQGHTDALDPNLWSVVKTVIISYFGGRSAEKVADKIAGVFRKT